MEYNQTLEKDLLALGIPNADVQSFVENVSTDQIKRLVFHAQYTMCLRSDQVLPALKVIVPALRDKKIETLGFQEIPATQAGQNCFATKPFKCTPERLNLWSSAFRPEEIETLAGLINPENLKTLDVMSVCLKNSGDQIASLMGDAFKEIRLSNTDLSNETCISLALKIKETQISLFDLNQNGESDQGRAMLLGALPVSVQKIGLSRSVLDETSLGVLLEKLKTFKNLTTLELNNVDLDDAKFIKIIEKLPNSVGKISLKDNPKITNKSAEKLLDLIRRPNSSLCEVDFFQGMGKTSVSEQMQERISQALVPNRATFERNQAMYQSNTQDELKAKEPYIETQIDQVQTSKGIKSMLFQSLETGHITTAFEKMKRLNITFTFDDLHQKNSKGQTILQCVCEKFKVKDLICPELFSNAKELQSVFDALLVEDRNLFSGKGGDPSFQAIKNKVMQKSIMQKMRPTQMPQSGR